MGLQGSGRSSVGASADTGTSYRSFCVDVLQDAELELTMITRRSVTAMEGATRVQNGLLDLDLAQAVTDRSFDVHEDFEEIMQVMSAVGLCVRAWVHACLVCLRALVP